MLKVVISGYGKMGHMVEAVLSERNIECAGITESVAGFDKDIAAQSVCIDFTTPDAFRKNYEFIASSFKAAVIGTTGWYDIADQVKSCFLRHGTPMIYASNFSVGVNVLFKTVERLSALLGKSGGYSPYIVEMHHCHKLDAPSGTARTLASIVGSGTGVIPDVQSVRCGEIPGIHTVGFEGHDDRLVIRHEAFSRRGFAAGAVDAAVMVQNMEGVHEFIELL